MGQHSLHLSLGPETVDLSSDSLQGFRCASSHADVKEFRFYAGERTFRADVRQIENSPETGFEKVGVRSALRSNGIDSTNALTKHWVMGPLARVKVSSPAPSSLAASLPASLLP
jgi:hypothetical protein